jgi:hypothetical protein
VAVGRASAFIVCAYFRWDCWLLGSRGSAVFLSHDDYGIAVAPTGRDAAALDAQLRALDGVAGA